MSYKPDTTNILYFTGVDADITNYKRAIVAPMSGSEIVVSASATSSSGSMLIGSWITDALGITSIPYGNWNFNFYASVDDASGATGIKTYVYKSNTSDVESELFNFSIADVNDLTPTLQLGTYNPNALSLSATDRLSMKFYTFTDSATPKTISLYLSGATHQSRVLIPANVPIVGDMLKVIYDPEGDGTTSGSGSSGSGISSISGSGVMSNTAGSVVKHNVSSAISGSYLSANVTIDQYGHITAIENGVSASSVGAPSDSPFITSASATGLTNYKVLTAGSNVQIDNVAGSIIIHSLNSASSVTYSGSSPITVSGSVISHNVSGVSSGSYNQISVDIFGHITAGSVVSSSGSLTTSVAGSSVMSDTTGSIVKHNISGVTAGSYASANIIIDSFGHITSASSTTSGSTSINYAFGSISHPPNSEEISSIMGDPYTVGRGFMGLLDNSGSGVYEYVVFSDGDSWFYHPLIKSKSILGYDVLTRYGTIIEDAESGETTALESSVIIENGLWRMWYTYGWTTSHIGYATSPNGKIWTKYAGNPVIVSPMMRSCVFKSGATYYLYGTANDNQIDQYTSSDGISWTLANSSVLNPGVGGAWDASGIANTFVWVEDSNWYMLYEAKGASGIWKMGLATSNDGISWTKSASNPVINPTGGVGGPFVYKNGSTYYLWAHRSPSSTLPTDIVRYHSTNLTSWTDDGIFFARLGVDEGEGSSVGQAADPFIVVHNHIAYLYYDASSDGNNSSGQLHIKLATATENIIWQ